jgi:hypothetical protein
MELTSWNGKRNPGKNPIMQRFYCSELSEDIASVILRLQPTGCLESGSRMNLVLELETLTLSVHELWVLSEFGLGVLVFGFIMVWGGTWYVFGFMVWGWTSDDGEWWGRGVGLKNWSVRMLGMCWGWGWRLEQRRWWSPTCSAKPGSRLPRTRQRLLLSLHFFPPLTLKILNPKPLTFFGII